MSRRTRVLAKSCLAVVAAMTLPLSFPTAALAAAAADGLDDDWTHGAHDLLGYVPTDVRGTCTVSSGGSNVDSEIDQEILDSQVAALACLPPGGASEVHYNRFDTAAHADGYFDQLLGLDGSDPDGFSDDSDDCPSSTTYSLGRRAETVGRYVCVLNDQGDASLAEGAPIATWTYEPLAIVVQAWNTESDLEALHEFWVDDGGPLSEAERTGIPPLATPASLRAAGAKLLTALPPETKAKCQVIDSMTEDRLQELYPWRLWIVADVEECRPRRGSTDSEYVRFANVDSMNDYYDAILPDSDDSLADQRVKVGGIECAGSGTYQAGGRRGGRYFSAFSFSDTDAREGSEEFAHISWTSVKGKIVGSGGSPAADATALIRWWQEDAGPIRGR